MRRIARILATVFALVVVVQAAAYTTTFPLTENPISEGGAWRHLDPTLTNVRTELLGGVHVAHGTMVGGAFDDSSAYLAGFALNQSIEATIWKSASIAATPNDEVELLLRWADDYTSRSTSFGPTSADGYEININQNGDYCNIGRFKGVALDTFIPSAVIGRAPATGDRFRAQIVTSGTSAIVTLYWNDVQIRSFTDTAPHVSRGNPGIGFYIDSGGNNAQYGFSTVTASDGLGAISLRALRRRIRRDE